MLKFVLRAVLTLAVAVTGLVVAQSPAMAATVGPVYLWGYDSQRCIDDPNGATANNVVMIIYTCHQPRTANQSWTFTSTDSGYWTIKNSTSGKCLTVQNASTAVNATILQYTCNNGTNAQWTPEYSGYNVDWGWHADYYRLKNRKSGLCLTVKNASISNNATLLQYDCNNGPNQVWSWAPDLRLHAAP